MKAEAFDWKIHKEFYVDWFNDRDIDMEPIEFCPPTGIIVFNDGPVCIGFLCKTDAGMAIITNLISNPFCEKDRRSESLDFLIKVLVDIAKAEDFKLICVSTKLYHVSERFLKHEFKTTDENFINLGRFLCGFQ